VRSHLIQRKRCRKRRLSSENKNGLVNNSEEPSRVQGGIGIKQGVCRLCGSVGLWVCESEGL
jgi:hypothetical protein